MSDQPVRASISTDPNEAPGGRRPGGGRRPPGGDRGAESEPPAGGGGPGGPGYALFAVSIVGLLVAGWFIFSQQRALAAGEAELEAARTRILALEERLNMTDQALNQSGEKTGEKIDFWESEIRKLWDGNKRNAESIKVNAGAIEKANSQLSELDGAVAEMTAGFGRHESAFARQEQMVDQLTSIGAQQEQLQRALRDAIDKANAAQQSVAGLNAGLAKRVTETEQAVEAFDAYRLQTNARLADIERRIGAPPL
jgi:methyl-accepting chemotaxis protein